MEAVLAAMKEEKPSFSLKEEEPTSLLFPGDSDFWNEVSLTFSAGRLEADCASRQFNEELHRLPEHMIKSEYEARKRMQRSLHTCMTIEFNIWQHPEVELFKVIMKSTLTTPRFDFTAFATARRTCRRHVLTCARTRHEPEKLIKGSLWGKDLFPSDMVRDSIQDAEKAGKSLKDCWGIYISQKRKSQDFRGPQPKNLHHKKPRLSQPPVGRLPKVQTSQVPTFMLPMVPQNPGNSGQVQPMVLMSQQSPAFNSRYESQPFQSGKYNAGGSGFDIRGGRGRGRGGRGRGRGHINTPRGGQQKGNPKGRGQQQSDC